MSQPSLPDPVPDAPSPALLVDRGQLGARLGALAERGLWIGTSSWKYDGWIGSLYTRDRYVFRGKLSEARFERECLSEYSGVFRTVCVDAAYYTFPTEKYLTGLAAQVPDGFQFTFKVTDEITVRRFPKLPRFGAKAGTDNPAFLDAELFARRFLGPLETIRSKVGLLIFEFSRFYPSDYARGRDFVEALDAFLGRLPTGWRYGVEIRNRTFLQPEYFACLARHGVAHVLNSWEAMPPLGEQLALPGSLTTDFTAARLLLRPGRAYEEAVQAFAPYDRLQDEYPEGRAAAVSLVAEALRQGKRWAFIYVNNRFEGSALGTIQKMLEALAAQGI